MKTKWNVEPSANHVDWLIREGDTTILITNEDGKGEQYRDYERAQQRAILAAAAPELLEACIESLAALKSGYIEQRARATELCLNAIKKVINN